MRPSYEDLVMMLEPIYLEVRSRVFEPDRVEKEWGKARRKLLIQHGWDDDEFYRVMDSQRWEKMRAFRNTPASEREQKGLGVPAIVPEPTQGPGPIPPPPEEIPAAPAPVGSVAITSGDRLSKFQGQSAEYTAKNRRHTFTQWEFDSVLVSVFDATTGVEYWSSRTVFTKTTRALEGVREARKGTKYGRV